MTLYNHKDFRELEAFSIRIARLTLLLGVGVAAPLLLFAGEFLSIFGSEFSQGISVLPQTPCWRSATSGAGVPQ